MGKTALIEIDNRFLVIATSKPGFIVDRAIFESHGVDIREQDFIVMKSQFTSIAISRALQRLSMLQARASPISCQMLSPKNAHGSGRTLMWMTRLLLRLKSWSV